MVQIYIPGKLRLIVYVAMELTCDPLGFGVGRHLLPVIIVDRVFGVAHGDNENCVLFDHVVYKVYVLMLPG